MALTSSDIAHLRLSHQQVVASAFKDPRKLVSWMGAIQAQDMPMATWAVGTRTGAGNQKAIRAALDKGDIIRTHVMRPTWHFIASEDASWMLELTAPHIRKSLVSRHRQLGISPVIVKKSYRVIEKALAGKIHLTREALVQRLDEAKINTRDQRAAHILLMAELDRLICSGSLQANKPTYSLFAERVKTTPGISREEALARLATKYFSSHGPATLEDFVWWSGLPVTEARKAIEAIKHKFISEKIASGVYWFNADGVASQDRSDSVSLLPAFDEFIIGYKDRSACLTAEKHRATVTMNGIFRPVIVINDVVCGTWKRTLVKNKVIVETEFFRGDKAHKSKEIRKLIDLASERVRSFFGDEVS